LRLGAASAKVQCVTRGQARLATWGVREAAVASKKQDPDAPIIIKKYANRRLYNTAQSSYVTLDHLAQMVRDGEDFVVYDAKTEEDITRSVLTQIIFEEEAKGQNMLPTKFLRQLIQLYGDALQGVVPSYLEASMEAFARNQEQMREQMRSAMGANPAFANLEAMTRTNMELFSNAMRMFSPFSADGAAEAAKTADDPAASAGGKASEGGVDLTDLKSQLDEMRAKLDALSKPS
jgi:polyhydroxyalkanoate synthesis repressor PhaR